MNAKKNFMSCLECQDHTKTPTFLFDLTFGIGVAGYTAAEVFGNQFDGEKSAQSIIASRRLLGHDAVIGSVLAVDSRPFGSEMLFPQNGPPITKKAAFSDPLDLYKHDANEINNQTMENIIYSYNLVKKKDPEAFLIGHIPSPLLLATAFRGFETFMMDIAMDESYVDDLLKFSATVANITQKRIIRECEPDCVIVSAAYDNIDLIGKDGLNKLSLPYIKNLVKNASDEGKDTIFHPHGSLTSEYGVSSIKDILSSGIKCIYYGENNDPQCLSRHVGEHTSLMGGIDTFSTIYLGTDSRIINDTVSVLNSMRHENYIFSCSCSIDYGLDARRLKLMMDAVKKWG